MSNKHIHRWGVLGYDGGINFQSLAATEFELFLSASSIYDESHHRHNTMSCSHWRSLSSFAFGLIYSTIRGYCSFLVCLYRLQILTRCFSDQKPLRIVWIREQDSILHNIYRLNFFIWCRVFSICLAVHAFCCEPRLAAKTLHFNYVFSFWWILFRYCVVWLPALSSLHVRYNL